MKNRDDCMALELGRQQERLKYIRTTTARETYCDFPPRRVFFEPTNFCNVNCIHCVHDGQMTRPKGFIDVALVEKVMKEIKHLNRCSEICLFQQGEPLLHPQIMDIIYICGTKYDFFTKMNTNGLALTRKMAEGLLRNNLDYLVFSLDAITPETFKRIKRRDSFTKVINNILDYLEVWGELNTGQERNYFACDVNVLEEDANRHEIPHFKGLLKKLPIGHVSVYRMHNFTGSVQEVNEQMGDKWSLPREQWPSCNSPWDVVGIRWNGDVVSCIYDYDSKYVIGNVNEEPLLDIWNGERMQAFRQGIIDRDYTKIECNGTLCSTCSVMWDENYQLPNDFHAEIKRMEKYLVAAIDRVARRYERTEALLEQHRFLKESRNEWLEELEATARKVDENLLQEIKDA